MDELKTARLRLRNWRDDDRAAFAAMNADPAVAQYLPSVLTTAESDALLERIVESIAAQGFGLWAVEIDETGAFAGFVGLTRPRFEAHFTPCVEIGWRLRSALWGKGYATEAARAAMHAGFTKLDLPEIVSFTVPANRASRRVMEKLGMRQDGEFDHPSLKEGHPLRRHVLYRLDQASYMARCASASG